MLRAVIETAAWVLVLAATLFLAAGRLQWPMGWAVLLVYAAFAAMGFFVAKPSLILERSKLLAGGEPSERVLAVAFAFFLYPGTLITCGLDLRCAWSPPLPAPARGVALALFAAGYGFALWAMRVNPFFATVVRIQSERGHRLVDRGPYRLVRHPGYAGTIAAHLALCIALGSLWALVPTALGSLLLAARAVREERTLEGGLAGYADYVRRIRWRLLPGVW
jgi:protein-S-isoprenylcysteine O-methyltransferase Ste14